MNLQGIREAVFSQADWAPTQSAEAVDRVNDFINRAHNTLALEAPFLFFESEVALVTQEDVVGSSTDTIRVTTDTDSVSGTPRNAWVILRDGYSGTSGLTDWPVDRSWDGRVIDIIESDGTTIHKNRIRTVWSTTVQGQDGSRTYFYLSLVRPWDVDRYGYGPFTYRIYTDLYYLPDDVIQYKSARLRHVDNWPLSVLGQDEAEQLSLTGYRQDLAEGIPRALFRRAHFQIPGPKVAPTVSATSTAVKWMGPEPAGEFEYMITYTWGKRDGELRNGGVGHWVDNALPWEDTAIASTVTGYALDRYREPLWESSPSPVSDALEMAAADAGQGVMVFPAIKLTLPNIEYMQGFMLKGTDGGTSYTRANYARSGWHVRIYRRRIAEDFTYYNATATGMGHATWGGQIADSLHKLDLSEKFYLLAEVRIDDLNEGYWTDDGTHIPDYHRPLRTIHGYQSIQMYPKPDDRYEIDIRCVRRPEELVDDTDAPRVHPEAVDVLIDKTLVLLYEHQGQHELAGVARARYNEGLMTLRKRYAEQRPPQEPIVRRMSRARPMLPGRGRIRKWWDTT